MRNVFFVVTNRKMRRWQKNDVAVALPSHRSLKMIATCISVLMNGCERGRNPIASVYLCMKSLDFFRRKNDMHLVINCVDQVPVFR